jgi:hypothetical protein
MLTSSHYLGVEIKIDLSQRNDGTWTGRCDLKWPDGRTATLILDDRVFTTRDVFQDGAIEDARRFIDIHPHL